MLQNDEIKWFLDYDVPSDSEVSFCGSDGNDSIFNLYSIMY